MGDHALLSPSGASRWLSCTPSARLEESFPDKAGEAAAEGTLAHALAELMLKNKLGTIKKTAYNKELGKITKNKLYSPDMFRYMDTYTEYVMEQYDAAKVNTKDALIFLETKLDMSDYVPDSFGTADVVIVADRILDFIDYKHGKGVPVSAEENKQMMLYALGAWKEFGHLYDIDTIRMTIYQPRLDNISVWEITVKDLLHWAETELRPKALLADKGEGEFNPGKACMFCKAKAICRANADYHLSLAKLEFQDAKFLSDEEVVDIIKKAETFKGWLSSVESYALLESVHNGKQWPGYKLVEGRSNRKYVSEEKVIEALHSNNFTDDQIFTKKLLGITALEKEITKPVFNEIVSPFLIKPQGAPALVPESDPRGPYVNCNSAASDFGDNFED
jgi:hypothetical protein